MSVVQVGRLAAAERIREQSEFERQSARVRTIKIIIGLLLSVCFWFSVPYAPLKMDQDPKKAALNEAQAYEGSSSRQIAMPVIALAAAYLLWRLPKRGRIGSRLLPIACTYVGWALLSAGWSDNPSLTAKRLAVFAINCFFAYTIARVFSVAEMALWGFIQTGIVALLSLGTALFVIGEFAPFDSDYRFAALMTANYQAMNLVICIICALTLLQKRPHWLRWIAPVMMACLVLLYLTRSRLGTIVGLLMIAVLVMRFARAHMAPHARALLLIATLMVAAPGLIVAFGLSGGGAAESAFMMGRNDTQNTSNLSNRAPLWEELVESVRDRPWLGYGYQGFWTPARVQRVSADQGWMVPHAHDTYLDQTLSLGLIGMLLYMGLLWGACAMAWRRFKSRPSDGSLYAAILLTWLSLTGIAESVPLDPYLPTMLAYACIIKMCMTEGSEEETAAQYDADEIINGLPRVRELEAVPSVPQGNVRRPVRRFIARPLG